jgi:hypothetical protein
MREQGIGSGWENLTSRPFFASALTPSRIGNGVVLDGISYGIVGDISPVLYFYTMKPITYRHNDQTRSAFYETLVEGTYLRYRVFVDVDHNYAVVLDPGHAKSLDEKVIWSQCRQPGEPDYDQAFIQALGEGVERSFPEVR